MNDTLTLMSGPDAIEENAARESGRPGLSIVVPVYRGAATIGRLVAALSELDPEGGLEVVLVNDGTGGLAAPLPAGTVRIYMRDVDGALKLIGESAIGHTPQGSDLSLRTGEFVVRRLHSSSDL